MLTARQQKAKAKSERRNATLSIRPASQRAQTAIIEQVTKYPAAVLRTGHDEAKQKVVTGGLRIGIVRQAFCGDRLGGTGRISALINGLDSRVSAKQELLFQNLVRPGPDDRPLSVGAMRNAVNRFFSGIKRMATHGYAPNINANQVVSAQPAYCKSSQVELTNFVHILEANGFLTSSKRRKHILTPAELNVSRRTGGNRQEEEEEKEFVAVPPGAADDGGEASEDEDQGVWTLLVTPSPPPMQASLDELDNNEPLSAIDNANAGGF
ncbi:related to transposase [Sporisorium reilianum f. sp. reilianum]|uniref:Related to transposase n=1 Tax=Sporisorium reilianum f. sp. reilianum TaxID=72559 RepID=A0A2N8UG84_9BASI|nr:related to transposase [Sporisorium reilianum f. sp. reilianum]